LPVGGLVLSGVVTLMLVGGVVGGAGSALNDDEVDAELLLELPALELEPALLDLELVPQAANSAALNSTAIKQRTRTI
jgi:hypothetical protein